MRCSRGSGCGSSRPGFEEVHERGNTEVHRLKDPGKWVPSGVGAMEGQAVGSWAAGARGGPRCGRRVPTTPDFGPGEEPRPAEGAPTATANHELL